MNCTKNDNFKSKTIHTNGLFYCVQRVNTSEKVYLHLVVNWSRIGDKRKIPDVECVLIRNNVKFRYGKIIGIYLHFK